MASPNVLSAIVRAARPTFRSREDRLAFAVHAYLLADGYKLVAVGKDADEAAADADLTEDVPPDGWNSLDGTYAFRYVDPSGTKPPLLVKALSVGDKLLVHWTAAGPGAGDADAHSLELPLDRFTQDTSSPDPMAGYEHLDDLASELRTAFDEGASGAGSGAGSKRSAAAVVDQDSAEAPWRTAPDMQPGPVPLGLVGSDDPLRVDDTADYDEPGLRRPAPPVYGVGAQDVVPPGFRAPGTGPGGLGIPGLESGGSYLGPGYIGVPAPQRGGPVPGARWDPIRPPGLEGFSPDDFPRPGRRGTHPDIQPPGPGRGADFDNMFG